MRFTIVVPLYNKAPYVRLCLESVLEQTEQDFEVVVVDDGSTDGSGAIVESMADTRIRLLRQENSGVSAARNRGTLEARGDWISFLDADDWLHPEFLARMGAVADSHHGIRFVACTCKSVPDEEDWRPEAWPLPITEQVKIIRDLPRQFMKTPIHTDTVVFRRDLLLELMPCFAHDFCQGEDTDLFFRAAEHTAMAYLPVELACYRMEVAGGLMSYQRTTDKLRFVERLVDRVRSGAVPPSLRSSTLWFAHRLRITVARSEFAAGRRLPALVNLFRGWRAMSGPSWWYTWVVFAGAPEYPLERLRGIRRSLGFGRLPFSD